MDKIIDKKLQALREKKSNKKAKKKAIEDAIKREKHAIDLKGLVFGRVASEVALLLSGKRKVEYLPYIDQGDYVVVYNLEKMKFRGGNKMEKKMYYHFSGYPGGIKGISLKDAKDKDYPKLFRRAVYRMLPKNKLRGGMIKRLEIFKEEIKRD